jgi:DnaA-homolog protein
MYTQLTLDLQLKDSYTFNNVVNGENKLLIDLLKSPNLAAEKQLYIWGAHNTGKTHLMQALCQSFAQQNKSISYLPLKQLIEYSPEVFQGQEAMDVCCIDDVQLLQNKADWQEALFDLINRTRENNKQLIFTADQPPAEINIQLKDLTSRLQWGAVFKLLELNDAQKCEALQQRAEARGFELADNVASYLLNNYNRDMADLFEMLDALDKAQLQQHRRLTIPFVKTVLSE